MLAWTYTLAALSLLLMSCSSEPGELGDTCESNADCAPDAALVCDDGYCFPVSCNAHDDCDDGLVCIDTQCRSPECGEDGDCEAGSLCMDNECIEGGCRTRADCDDGEVCRGTPQTCQPPPNICADDLDCPAGTSCWPPTGECRTNCSEESDCGVGEYCGDAGQCRRDCVRDTDCLSDERCVSGRCESLPDCSGQTPCSGQLRFRDPLTCNCVECLQNEQCDISVGEACTETNVCLFCQLQSDDVDCAERGLIARLGCCVECESDTECDSDAPFCDSGRCSALPPDECSSDEDCDDDQLCNRGRCEPAASFAPCDVQADCPDGEACFVDGRCHAEATSCGGCDGELRCIEGSTGNLCAGCADNCSTQACRDGRICVVPSGSGDGICIDEALATQCSG
ncbi:MAG: DUF7107 domain-containing protein [Myxococcota bacterium]